MTLPNVAVEMGAPQSAWVKWSVRRQRTHSRMGRHRLLVLSLFIMLTIAFAQSTFAQAPNEPLYIDLSKTLGFIMGQRYSLNRIKAEYPTLSLQVEKTELEFKIAFGTAEKNIEKSLRDLLEDKYFDYIAMMEEQIQSTVKSQRIGLDSAVQFLDEIELRAKGEIPSPILETLLNYQYEASPADELMRGFKTTYRTKGHPKAKGLDFQIEYPKSWSLREGKRPNIIQFFGSNNGRGPAYALIATRDIAKEAQGELTREEISALDSLEGSKELASELFSESSLREMANGMGMANVRNISS